MSVFLAATKYYRVATVALVLFVLCLQSGCALLGAHHKSSNGPAPINQFQSQASSDTTALRIFASQQLNQSSTGEPLAVLVRMYLLKDYGAFDNAGFDTFVNTSAAKAQLGSDLVAARETMLLPGKKYETYVPTQSQAQYLAVAVLFLNPDPTRWRAVFKLDGDHSKPITLGVNRCALIATSGSVVAKNDAVEQPLTSAHCPDH